MYRVLYRKWRPRVFSDVVGQTHITSTLQNEIINGRHAHAYLFTGSRGTGKTTCAKILSKAVNCLSPVDGNPCGECEICRGIENGTVMDVIEIDAASNNGVDNIRDIRQEANFAPASCKYRVYIIDEVHMLSAGAFNALLKTLEEPPERVMFILATTEVHKLPATILSRCQRFDFRRIPSEDMVARMKYIAEKENMLLEDDAALLISRIADGGMRDALSLLDQCFSVGDRVTQETVSRVAGLTGKEYLFRLTDALCTRDCAAAVNILDELHNSSCDMERLCSELINHYRSLMVIKTVNNPGDILVCTKDELDEAKMQAEKCTLENIIYTIDLLQDTLSNMKRGASKRTEMEMAVIKLSNPSLGTDSTALIKRISELEKAVKALSASQPENTEKPVSPASEKPQTEEKEADTESVAVSSQEQLQTPSAKSSQSGGDEELLSWPEVVNEIRKTNMPLWGVLSESKAYIRGDFLLVDCAVSSFGQLIRQKNNAADVRKAVQTVTGSRYRLGIYTREDTEKKKQDNDPLTDLIGRMRRAEIEVKEE